MADTPPEWTVISMLKWATSYFEQKNVRNPRLSIEWLLADVLNLKRLDLYLSYDRPLTADVLALLRPMVKRRAQHEPLQYITGETDFLNTKIKVAPGVLIPRMETEQLVDSVLKNHSPGEELAVIDLGTGSGCIPVALKKNRPEWKISATDISEEALNIASQNAASNQTEITFFKDDLFSPDPKMHSSKYDMVISNPPYILREEKDSLDKEVTGYEPQLALFCESTSSIYGAIEQFASQYLSQKGFLYLELHENHSKEVADIFALKKWHVSIENDYDSKPRFLFAQRFSE